MQKEAQKSREQFGSRLGFILAAAGSAIGLGNIWKFPFLAGIPSSQQWVPTGSWIRGLLLSE